jgi:hypothetical protein
VVRSINGLRDDFRIVGGDGVMVDTKGSAIVITAAPSCFTYTNCFWSLFGNGNVVAGVNFLGTVAGELDPLEFRVNNNRSLLHVFTSATTGPNLIGGYRGNGVSGTGGTIAGGGQLTGINEVLANYGTVSGGYSNVIQSLSTVGTISGGATNRVDGNYGAIGGGALNVVTNYSFVGGGSRNRALSDDTVIGGGEANTILNYNGLGFSIGSLHSGIGGGLSNRIVGAEASTIGGGRDNSLQAVSAHTVFHGTISGGRGNSILPDSFSSHSSTVGGGMSNVIHTAGSATIGGGSENILFLEGNSATIAGGARNSINGDSSVIAGGEANSVLSLSDHASIGGGRANSILDSSDYATIAGGQGNSVWGFARHSTIGGGVTNKITDAVYAVVGGGATNRINDGAHFATIGGGRQNSILANSMYSTIGGGSSNTVSGDYAVVPGGFQNSAEGNLSLAAGRRAIAQHNGTFVWADDTDADFSSTASKQFAVRADNGVMIQASTRALDLRGGGTVRVAGAGIGTSTPAFIHRATAANTAFHVTTINHPHCDGDPNAILMVTQNWNPGGGAGIYNNHSIGVYYTGTHWAIFNQDLVNMPVNAAFNVLVIKP